MLLPLKQGLKLVGQFPVLNYLGVVMLLPLKQGLKLNDLSPVLPAFWGCYATSIKTRIETLFYRGSERGRKHCCYATSIKTRIETLLLQTHRRTGKSCYATSIKTRIETLVAFLFCRPAPEVVMLLPLKQGLKHGLDGAGQHNSAVLLCYFH